MKAFLSNPSSRFAETFLATHYIQKDKQESTYWSDITSSRPNGPQNTCSYDCVYSTDQKRERSEPSPQIRVKDGTKINDKMLYNL